MLRLYVLIRIEKGFTHGSKWVPDIGGTKIEVQRALGQVWKRLGPSSAILDVFGSVLDRLGSVLERLGSLLGRFEPKKVANTTPNWRPQRSPNL